jgi:hypothetical protein
MRPGEGRRITWTAGGELVVDGIAYTIVRVNKASLRVSRVRDDGSTWVGSFPLSGPVRSSGLI